MAGQTDGNRALALPHLLSSTRAARWEQLLAAACSAVPVSVARLTLAPPRSSTCGRRQQRWEESRGSMGRLQGGRESSWQAAARRTSRHATWSARAAACSAVQRCVGLTASGSPPDASHCSRAPSWPAQGRGNRQGCVAVVGSGGGGAHPQPAGTLYGARAWESVDHARLGRVGAGAGGVELPQVLRGWELGASPLPHAVPCPWLLLGPCDLPLCAAWNTRASTECCAPMFAGVRPRCSQAGQGCSESIAAPKLQTTKAVRARLAAKQKVGGSCRQRHWRRAVHHSQRAPSARCCKPVQP